MRATEHFGGIPRHANLESDETLLNWLASL